MKIKYEEVLKIKDAIEEISIEFSPKNLSNIVVVISEAARVNKEKARHVLCCGSVIENGIGFQYSMPATKQCLTDNFETKLTYYNTLLETTDEKYEREEIIEIKNVYSV